MQLMLSFMQATVTTCSFLTICAVLGAPAVAQADVLAPSHATYADGRCGNTARSPAPELYLGFDSAQVCGTAAFVTDEQQIYATWTLDTATTDYDFSAARLGGYNRDAADPQIPFIWACIVDGESTNSLTWNNKPECIGGEYLMNPGAPATPQQFIIMQHTEFRADIQAYVDAGNDKVTFRFRGDRPTHSGFGDQMDPWHWLHLTPHPFLEFASAPKPLPECLVDADCDLSVPECVANECNAGVCEYPDEPVGTECSEGSCIEGGICVPTPGGDPLPDSYIDLDVCGEPGSSTHTECLGINAFCPCAEPGGYGGALQEYGWGHWFWGPWSFFNCGKEYVEGIEDLGTPMTEWLRLELRDAYWPGNSINVACWEVD